MVGIEQILMTEKSDVVLIYGNTNSSLVGTLAVDSGLYILRQGRRQ